MSFVLCFCVCCHIFSFGNLKTIMYCDNMLSVSFVSCSHICIRICKLFIFLETKCIMLMEGAFETCLTNWTLWESFKWRHPRSWNSVIGIWCLNMWGVHFWVYRDFTRLAALLEEISSDEDNKTLVFVETKRKVENITRSIRRCGWVVSLLLCILHISVI